MIKISDTTLAQWQHLPLGPNQTALWWLGQAGFLIRGRDCTLVVDPYLSDSLAVKYREARFKHVRMMPVPVAPEALTGIDWVFCTHRHTDHMDGGTLPGLVTANPDCPIVVPAAAAPHLINVIGVDRGRVRVVDAGSHVHLQGGLDVEVIASAHESLEYDDQGHSLCLGYVFDLNGLRLYHSGDCVPYEGLTETLERLRVDVALLPVNGRDPERTGSGILGNFHFEEAVSLCCDAGIGMLIPHHFGMFDFNTVDPSVLRSKIDDLDEGLQVVVPRMDQALLVDG